MRCPDCNKFASMDFADPEVESIDIDSSGEVTCSVRLLRTCSDCGTDLKEYTLELSEFVDVPDETKENAHDFEVEETSVSQIEESGGRYKKSYFGASVSFTVKCNCGCDFNYEGTISDKIPASQMEEMT